MNYHLTFQATQPFLKAENPHAISTAPPMDGMNAFESFLAFEEANPPLPLIGHYPSNKTVFGEGEVEKVWQVEVTDFGVGTGRWVTIPKTQNIEQFKNDNTRQAIQYTPNKATVDCSTLSGEREEEELVFKGTPGPWVKAVRNHTIMAIIPKKYGERVIETILKTGYISDDDCGIETCCLTEEHANAKLIAAAPELLEFAIEMVKRYLNSPWIYEQANKAIKKALI